MIATVCDEGEFLFRIARHAICSAARCMPDHPFCLVLINGSGHHDDEIRRWHPRLILKHKALEIRPEFLRGYRFCYMTLPLHDLLCEFDGPLVYVDADTLFRGRLEPVFAMLEEYDIVMRYQPFRALPGPTTATDGARVNNGCLGLANNDRTRQYTAELRRRVVEFLESGRDPSLVTPGSGIVTGLDQELLWVIYREMASRLRFFPLDDRFNDSQLRDDSVLWHGKGTARRNPRYLFEVARRDRDLVGMAREWPKRAAVSMLRLLRTWVWRRTMREAFVIPHSELESASGPASRILVVNSCFLRYNPGLLEASSIACVDVDPDWYYHNKTLLKGRSNVRHSYVMPDKLLPEGEYDVVVTDRPVPMAHSDAVILRTSCAAEALKWRRARVLQRPAPDSGYEPCAVGATAGAES